MTRQTKRGILYPKRLQGLLPLESVKRAEKPITKNGTMWDCRDNVWLWRNQTIWRDNVVRNSLMTLSNRDNMQNTSRISDNIVGKICEERLVNK